MIYFLCFKTKLRFSLTTLQQHTVQPNTVQLSSITFKIVYSKFLLLQTSYFVKAVLQKFQAGNTVHMHQLTSLFLINPSCSCIQTSLHIDLNIEIFIINYTTTLL